DFEDMLAFAVRLFDEHPAAAEEIRGRFRSFTVDEYQDVNPLQDALLERWLGDRDDLCVVGDDYQTIYGFTGASPSYLLGFRRCCTGSTRGRIPSRRPSPARASRTRSGTADSSGAPDRAPSCIASVRNVAVAPSATPSSASRTRWGTARTGRPTDPRTR